MHFRFCDFMLENDDEDKDHSQFSLTIQNTIMAVCWPTEMKGDSVWPGQGGY